ncbi:uncharacterized protein V6R79_003231 [Siganus canaliculatus]
MKRHVTVIPDDDDQEEEIGRGRVKTRSGKTIPRKKKTMNMEEDEQPGPSTQNVHSHKENKSMTVKPIGLLAVTCGNKSGIMDVDMLQRGEDCIRYNDEWISPPAFEELGGKASSKKWKSTIFYEDKPLQFWFKQGHLTTRGYKRRSNGIPKQIQTPPSPPTSDSSSEESEPDDVNDDNGSPKRQKLEGAASESLAFSELTESGADTSREEVDTGIEPELDSEEDEDMTADAGNIQTADEWEALIKSAQQREPRVFIKRHQFISSDQVSEDLLRIDCPNVFLKVNADCQYNRTEHLPEETKPLNERRQNKEDIESNHSSIASNTDDIQNMDDAMSAPEKINTTDAITDTTGASSTESQELVKCERDNNTSATTSGTEDAQLRVKEIWSLAPEPPDDAQSPDRMEDPPSQHSSSRDEDTMDLDQLRREKITIEIRVLRLKEEYLALKIKNLKNVSSEITHNGTAGASSTESQELVECERDNNTSATTSGTEDAQLRVKEIWSLAPETNQPPDDTQSHDRMEDPPSQHSSSRDENRMDLDQLRREKITIEIRVFRLLEEYLAMEIKNLKK